MKQGILDFNSNEEELLAGLNEAQKEAVTFGSGPCLVVAGAGTGKTLVITKRIAYLITNKICKPDEILALTFTEKAAKEMEERVDRLVPYTYSYSHISTFNSFGESILKEFFMELGFPSNFKLLDDIGQAIFMREKLFELPLKHFRPLGNPTSHIERILDFIKRAKQEDISSEEYLEWAQKRIREVADESDREEFEKHLEMAQAWSKYRELMEKEGKIDFEDQIWLLVKLIERKSSILDILQNRYRYILVDEFQDTNYIQFKLLRMIAGEHRNIMVVGDDDQSIYKFRGAAITNILNFLEYYPDAKTIVLRKNYRSETSVLESAYRLIKFNNPNRLEAKYNFSKELEPVKRDGRNQVNLIYKRNEDEEAEAVAEIIEKKIKEGVIPSEIAILVRRNQDAEAYLRALSSRGIPYRFSGSRGLYSKPEIKAIIAFIKSLTDPLDNMAHLRLAVSEVYGLSSEDAGICMHYSKKRNLSLRNVFKIVSDRKVSLPLSDEGVEIIKKNDSDLRELSKILPKEKAESMIYTFLQVTGWLKKLQENPDDLLKIQNIAKFLKIVKNFSDSSPYSDLYTFSTYLDLLQEMGDNPPTAESEPEEDSVNVLTVHKAKGLEFKIVFMVSLVMDRFPSRERGEFLSIPDELLKEKIPEPVDKFEEERRLFFVGMTRAKDELYLCAAREYNGKPKRLSKFVIEALNLPKEEMLDQTTNPLTIINSTKPSPPESIKRRKIPEILPLSFDQINTYRECPLKYRFFYIDKIPPPPHHALNFGRAIHFTIRDYLKLRMGGKRVPLENLFEIYNSHWIPEGFIDRRHEEMRYEEGKRMLESLWKKEESSDLIPVYVEKEFKIKIDRVKFIGRWDRIDMFEDGAVIIDYKASKIKDQKSADKEARDNLQLSLYCYSFERLFAKNVKEVRLFYLDSGIEGIGKREEIKIEKALNIMKDVEEGVRDERFEPNPGYFVCDYCPYKRYCPAY
ncbi:MAG: ATP-dependent helicase [Candidatus Aminicenantia bacterium]